MAHGSYEHTGYPEHFDYEEPDPPADESVKVKCVNPECEESKDPDSYWHPTTESEYQGIFSMGGMVDFFTDDAFTCKECGAEGEELA